MKKPVLALSLLWAAAILAAAVLIDDKKDSAAFISLLAGCGASCIAVFSEPRCRRP